MKIITDLYNGINEPCAIALGTFDGVHKGHYAVLSAAAQSEYKRGAVCFNAPPQSKLKGEKIPLISDSEIKEALLESAGMTFMVSMDFEKVCALSPEEFFDILADKYNAKLIACGYNFRFGKGGVGDAALLKKMGEEKGIEVRVIDEIVSDKGEISSTAIRSLIANGEMELAAELLGHPFMFRGKVVHGKALGKKMGIPTINQKWNAQVILPKFGVYASLIEIDGKVYKGITNIGINPTFPEREPIAESYILDFSGDLYDKDITVSLTRFIRPEQKFENESALKEQILKDIETVNKKQ